MTESDEFKDDLIRDIVKKGVSKNPNLQFEDQMMLQIQKEVEYKNQVSSQLRISLQFFAGAFLLGAGLILFVLLPKR